MPKKLKKSKVSSCKTKPRRKNPPSIKDIDPQLIDYVFYETDQMADALKGWNIKYDVFPDTKKWLDKNFVLPFGKVIVQRYFDDIMKTRSEGFWGITHFSTPWLHMRRIRENYSNSNKYYALKQFYKTGQYRVLSPEEFEKRMKLHEEKMKAKLEAQQKKEATYADYKPIDLDDFDF
jgi:hypothetical protein